jgi:hypothetical protein
VVTAHRLARSSEKISASMIEVTGFPHLTQKFAVRAVPKVILNETHDFTGSLPETDFVKMILEAGGKRKSRPA